jgi:hypothetical protein
MPRDDRKVDIATLGDLAHRAGPSALHDAAKQAKPSRITEGLEPRGIKKPVDWPTATHRMFRSPRPSRPHSPRSALAYLHHDASVLRRHADASGDFPPEPKQARSFPRFVVGAASDQVEQSVAPFWRTHLLAQQAVARARERDSFVGLVTAIHEGAHSAHKSSAWARTVLTASASRSGG